MTADGARGETLDRSALRTIQTPQAFRFDALLAAHRRAAEQGREDFTDDGALFAWAGGRVALFRGRGAQREAHDTDEFDDEPCAGRASNFWRAATCAPGWPSTSTPSGRATM